MRNAFLRCLIPALGIFLPIAADAATLSLSPSSGSFGVGSYFTASIILDTAGAEVQGVDVDGLNYNPALLEVQDDNPSQSGVQIAAGSLMPVTAANSVDATAGRILFSQITTGGGAFSGRGTLAQIRFLVRASGQAGLTFNFSPGSTSDSNVASSGADVLSSVGNGSYSLTSGAPSPSLTPAPVPPPAASTAPATGTSSPAPTAASRPTPRPAPTPSFTASAPRAPGRALPSPQPASGLKQAGAAKPDTPEARTQHQKILEKFQDPFSIYLAAIVVLFSVLGVTLAYKIYRGQASINRMDQDHRVEKIVNYIISNLSKRRTMDEVKNGLSMMKLDPDDVEEAFRRLRFK